MDIQQESMGVGVSEKPNPKKWLFFVVILLLLIFVVVLISQKDSNLSNNESQNVSTENNVEIFDKVPDSFPSDIPLEGALDDSMRGTAVVSADGNVLYSVTFSSTLSKADAYTFYLKYMNDMGYQFRQGQESGLDEENGFLYGSLADDDLSVSIGEEGARTSITLNYLDRNIGN